VVLVHFGVRSAGAVPSAAPDDAFVGDYCFSGAPPGDYLVCDELRITPLAGAAPTVEGDPAATDAVARTLRHAVNGRFLIGVANGSRHLL
jgi:hypothetical protein